MTDFHRRIYSNVPLLVTLVSLCLLAACESAPRIPPESATPRRQPINQWVAPEKVPSLTSEDLRLTGEDVERDALEKRFAVSREVAEAWAVNWVIGHRELQGHPDTCFYLPWRDGDGRILAHQFVLTDRPDCASFEGLTGEMTRIAVEARGALATEGEGSEADLLRERTRISSQSFFTLAVSAHSFQHPLRDGIKGLPFWMIARDRLPEGFRATPAAPTSLYPVGNRGGLIEVVEYPRADEPLLFSHHLGRSVERGELRVTFDLGAAYERWQRGLMERYGDNVEERLVQQGNLWSRYLTGEER